MKEQALIKVLHGMIYAMSTIEQNLATINTNNPNPDVFLMPSNLETIKHNLHALAVPERFNAFNENGDYKAISFYPVKGFAGVGEGEWGEREFPQDFATWNELVTKKTHLADQWEVNTFGLILREKEITLYYYFNTRHVSYTINGTEFEEVLPANAIMYNHMIDRMRVLIGFDEKVFKETAAQEQHGKVTVLRKALDKVVKELTARDLTGFVKEHSKNHWASWLPETAYLGCGVFPNPGASEYSDENPTTLTFTRNNYNLSMGPNGLHIHHRDTNRYLPEWELLDLSNPVSYTLTHHKEVSNMVDVMLDTYFQVLHTVPSLETIEVAKQLDVPKFGWRAAYCMPFNTNMFMGEGQPTVPLQRTVSIGSARPLTDEECDYIASTLHSHSLPAEVKEPAKWNRMVDEFCNKVVGVLSKALETELIVDTTVPFVLVYEDGEEVKTQLVMSKSIPALVEYYTSLTGALLEPVDNTANYYRVVEESSKEIDQQVLGHLLRKAAEGQL